MVFDHHFRLPAVQQGSLTVERRFGHRAEASVGYVFNLDRQLPSSTDLNISPARTTALFQLQGGTGGPGVRDGETFALPLYTTRLSPSFGPVTDILSNANGTYHSLVLSGQLHPSAHLRVQSNYTWSKAIDFGPSLSATPRTDNQLDPFADGYDKGLSALNYPWSSHTTAVWQPEPHLRAHWLQDIASGWQAAPIFVAHSGRPYSFDLSGGTRLPGGHDSINGSGGALYLPTVGRNTQRLPALANVDLRVARSVRLGRRTSPLQLRGSAEAFNLLNHQNISSVEQRAYLVGTPLNGVTPLVFQDAAHIAAEGLNTQPFGTPTASSSSLARERQLQFGVRLQF